MERQIKPFFGDVICYFTRHATAANLVLGLMIILGLVASTRLRSQFFPDVVINTITEHLTQEIYDEWYAKIMFIHPPRTGPSLQDGFLSSDTWKEEKNMSGELLTKVKRNNKIVVEFKGLSTISRTD